MLGFWSYVHADDSLDFGRIVNLAHDIVGNYEAIRGEKIELFLDRDDLKWGDDWRAKVDDSLANVAFFIPVVTPRYFKSIECRRELQFFLERTGALGIRQIILPILYISVPELLEDDPEDPLVAAIKRAQWEPWVHLRMKERASEDYRSSVFRLAEMLVERVRSVEQVDIVAAVEKAGEVFDSEGGILDRLVALEEAMPLWNSALTEVSEAIQEIGSIMKRGTDDMSKGDRAGKGFAARLTVARRVASEIEGPVDRIEGGARSFVAALNDVDSGVRALVTIALNTDMADPDEGSAAASFLSVVDALSVAANQGLSSAVGLVNASAGVENMSTDMRRPMRRFRESLTSMYEAREITDSWVTLINDAGLRQYVAAPEAPPLT